MLSQALVWVVAGHVRVGMGARLLRPDHLGGHRRNPSSAIWTRHGPHTTSVNLESDGCQLGRSSLGFRGQHRGDALNTSLSLALKPTPDSSEVDFEAGDSQALACRKRIPKKYLRQVKGHDAGVATLQPSPLRMRPFRKSLGQRADRVRPTPIVPQQAQREYRRGLINRSTPNAVRYTNCFLSLTPRVVEQERHLEAALTNWPACAATTMVWSSRKSCLVSCSNRPSPEAGVRSALRSITPTLTGGGRG